MMGLLHLMVLILGDDAIMVVLQLVSLHLGLFFNLCLISLERKFHSFGVVNVISSLPDKVLLVPDNLRESGRHYPGFGLMVIANVHLGQLIMLVLLLLHLELLHLFLFNFHFNLVDHGFLFPFVLLLLSLLAVSMVIL
jgi:hypothetical protein